MGISVSGVLLPLLMAAALIALALLPGLRSFGEAALPLKIHNIAWGIALGLVGSQLILYGPIRLSAWIYLAAGVAFFNIGALVSLVGGGSIAVDRHPTEPPVSRAILLEWVVPGLFFVGCMLYLSAVSEVFGLGALISDPALVRSQQGSDAFKAAYGVPSRILFGLGPLCFVIYAVPSVSGISTSRLRRWMVLSVTTTALAASLGRTLLLVCFAWVATAWLLATPSRRPRRRKIGPRRRHRLKVITLLVIGGLILFQGLAVFLGKTAEADARIQRYVSPALRGSALTSVIVYLTGGVASFSVLVGSDVDQYPQDPALNGPFYGLNLVAPAARLFGQNPPDVVRPFTFNPLPNNSYTYLDTFWLDFREFGIVVGAFVFGFGLTAIARHRSRSPESLLMRSLFIALLLWVPFSYKYNETFAWVSVAILWFSSVSRPRRRGSSHLAVVPPRETVVR